MSVFSEILYQNSLNSFTCDCEQHFDEVLNSYVSLMYAHILRILHNFIKKCANLSKLYGRIVQVCFIFIFT